MQLSKILFVIFSIAFAIGAVDRIFGNKLKLGSKIEEGFTIMAKAIFSMIGILYLYPFLGILLVKPAKFFAKLFYTDSSVLISCFLPIDMGGYHISLQVSGNEAAEVIGGILISSNLGATFVLCTLHNNGISFRTAACVCCDICSKVCLDFYPK